MPEGKTYRAELEFLGRIDPSVHKSFKELDKEMKETAERSAELREHFKEMTEHLVEFGIAVFALDEAKRGMEWLIENAALIQYSSNMICGGTIQCIFGHSSVDDIFLSVVSTFVRVSGPPTSYSTTNSTANVFNSNGDGCYFAP